MGGAFMPLWLHFAPMILQHLSEHQAELDRCATSHKDEILPLVQSLRESLEPFEEFQQTKSLLDELRPSGGLEGLGVAMTSFLAIFCSMEPEKRHEVGSLVLGPVMEKWRQQAFHWMQNDSAALRWGQGTWMG